VAQFGRGIMGDVSKKLMEQFSANLNTMLDNSALDSTTQDKTPQDSTTLGSAAGNGGAVTDAPATGTADEGSVGAAAASTKRVINGPATEPIDMAGMAGPAVLKRIVPAVLGLLIVFLLLRRRR
jgi:hypothetical protein